MLSEQLSDDVLPVFCLSLLQEYKYKKLEIDKRLDEIINVKINQIEKDTKKVRDKSLYLGNAYIGQKNKSEIPHGIGNLLLSNTEDLYNGQFDNGLKHGLGKYTYFSGGGSKFHPFLIPYYSGEWFADSYHGIGKHFITDFEFVCSYEGIHTHDIQNGFATFKKFNKPDQKVCNTELIGNFINGESLHFMVEIHRDENGNLSKETPSGVYEYAFDDNSKTPLLTFKEMSEWDGIKPKKMDKDMSKIYNDFYEPFFNLDPFKKEYSDIKFRIKKDVTKLMHTTYKYFEMNTKNKDLVDFASKVNALNKIINKVGEIQQLNELENKTDELMKEFNIIIKKIY